MMSVKARNEIPDCELVDRIVKGDKELFETIIRRYNQRLYRIGMSVLNNEPETEDAMQTAYIHAYESLSGFEGRSSFGTWLTRIMLNQCYAQKRKPKNSVLEAGLCENTSTMKSPAGILLNKELGRALEDAISMLPEKYRLVFVLREIEELSVRETSEALCIEEPNVKVRLNRAKAMLRENLTGYMKSNVYDFHLSKCDRMVYFVMNHLKFR